MNSVRRLLTGGYGEIEYGGLPEIRVSRFGRRARSANGGRRMHPVGDPQERSWATKPSGLRAIARGSSAMRGDHRADRSTAWADRDPGSGV
jgi:hypothetical protein